ncbi:DUF503 domain-containing protein [Sandaracinus amylolyticus]|uniref:DUF503 domain-containing protein n=1 Tax=Sandaracinus amylolyticus TaxID=927083 RepID=UPI001F3DF4E4|nr:DUF503 domain-containing protein [Sandaracinus amylolyticus]UJR81136.1 DUF503 domain-containing protein [Sandaracinus amylolyticus]
MIVGVCRIVLALPSVDSLKGKRSIVRRIVDRVRHKFNAAIAEVAEMDAHRRAVLGFAVVSNDARHANSMIDTIVSFVSSATEALVIDRSMEIVHLEDHFGGGLDAAIDRSYDEPGEDDDDGR